MTDYVIPCDTFHRLSHILDLPHPGMTDWFRSIRIDNGLAVVSNRISMAVENIGGPSGVVHVTADPVLIKQCADEAQYGSSLTITVVEALQYATAKTTLGYVHPGNVGVWSTLPNDYDRWRAVVEQARTPATKSKGGMMWHAENIANVAAASPSGRIVFEENIDTTRPTIIRDVTDYNWFAIFNPASNEYITPATLPTWMVS